jgi:hypothetical protein
MELGISANIFANQLEVISADVDTCVIRTKEIVPFTGDFLAVQVTIEDLENAAISTLINVHNDDMFEDTDGNEVDNCEVHQAAFSRAARKMNRILSKHVESIVSDFSKSLGCIPATNFYYK